MNGGRSTGSKATGNDKQDSGTNLAALFVVELKMPPSSKTK